MRFLLSAIVTLLFLNLLSCQENSNSPLQEARSYFAEYLISHDKAFLDSSYYSLTSQNYLKDTGLNQQNNDLITILFLYMRKYDELENLLNSNDDMDDFDKNLAINLVRSLRVFKDDSIKAKGIIQENLRLIESEMTTNPNDSLLWMGYFRMRIYLVGKQKALQEIDSLRSIETRYSNLFYDNYLIDPVEEYPNELLY